MNLRIRIRTKGGETYIGALSEGHLAIDASPIPLDKIKQLHLNWHTDSAGYVKDGVVKLTDGSRLNIPMYKKGLMATVMTKLVGEIILYVDGLKREVQFTADDIEHLYVEEGAA